MAENSSIEWCGPTWNVTTGCDQYSPGCKNCYAERMSNRLMLMGIKKYRNNFKLTLHEDTLDIPRKWKKPQNVFVDSMSDLFHKDVPIDYIQRVFKTMRECPQHTFLTLTKRSARLRTLSPQIDWPDNVMAGVSVEDKRVMRRITDLSEVQAKTRFLSCEPLIGPLEDMPLDGIHWVIVGGESGPGARPMDRDWVESIFLQCQLKNIPFFFKQWGGTNKKKAGRILDGKTYDEFPSVMRRDKTMNQELMGL